MGEGNGLQGWCGFISRKMAPEFQVGEIVNGKWEVNGRFRGENREVGCKKNVRRR